MNKVLNENAKILDSTGEKYDISICIITYNKEKYISDAIEGVLSQKTNCNYEIVVGDNASTDKTTDILKDYWKRAPEKFTILLNNTNLGLTTNMFNTMAKAKGRYIIILYGDDYWIDNNRLQYQFDFLEEHQDFIGVTAPIASRYDGQREMIDILPPKFLWNTGIGLRDYLQGYDFPMAGLMFRNDIFSTNLAFFYKMVEASKDVDDASFCILLLMKGDVFVLESVMGIYRVFKKEDCANNYNTVNTATQRCNNSICLCDNLDRLTDFKLDLSMRYGFILSSAFRSKMVGEISRKDYKQIESRIKGTKLEKKKILIRAIIRKIERKVNVSFRTVVKVR